MATDNLHNVLLIFLYFQQGEIFFYVSIILHWYTTNADKNNITTKNQYLLLTELIVLHFIKPISKGQNSCFTYFIMVLI